MYGLVNKAVEQMAVEGYGRGTWDEIRRRAGVDVDVFVNMRQYDDDLTYRLVGAASEVLGISPDEVLEAFGRYWILYSAKEGYGAMLDMGGSNLREFLLNLDMLHARVHMSFRELRPPSFVCTEEDETGLTLHYHSHRAGLTSFVVGLLRGLGERFSTPLELEILERKGQGADHDVFRITFVMPSEAAAP
jgi:Haem-NO-binding